MGQLGAQIYTVEDPGSAGPADCQGAGAGVTAGGNGGVTIIGETTTSVTIVGPSGERQTRTLSQRHVQHTPSMTGVGGVGAGAGWEEEGGRRRLILTSK